MKAFFDFISTVCSITGDSLIDTIIFMAIAGLSFFVAWRLTGEVADFTDSHNSSLMSLIHWAIRIIVFLLLLIIVYAIIAFIRWIDSWPWWGYIIFVVSIGALSTGVTVIVFFWKRRNQTRKVE